MLDEIGEALGKRSCFTGACASHDLERAVDMGDCLELLWIEVGKRFFLSGQPATFALIDDHEKRRIVARSGTATRPSTPT